jgi:hypothetical protein
MSEKVNVDFLKASMYFPALLRAILSRFADWLLLKSTARQRRSSCLTLYAGIGFWGTVACTLRLVQPVTFTDAEVMDQPA